MSKMARRLVELQKENKVLKKDKKDLENDNNFLKKVIVILKANKGDK